MKLLLLHTHEDTNYLAGLKSALYGHEVFLRGDNPVTTAEVYMYCKQRGIHNILCTNMGFAKRALFKSSMTLDNWAGSLVKIPAQEIELLFVPPIKQVFTVPHGDHVLKRFLSKITAPELWWKPPAFTYKVLAVGDCPAAATDLATAFFIAIDIETSRTFLSISCVAYTGVWINQLGHLRIHTYVLPITSTELYDWMVRFNQLPPYKLTQNGKYDNAYFIRYSAPLHNWLLDTAHLFHSWMSELPKSLDFIAAYLIREISYWKDEAESGQLEDLYRYNAKDGWATAVALLALLPQLPAYALKNYIIEFSTVFPCFYTEMEGLALVPEQRAPLHSKFKARQEQLLSTLRTTLATPGFNPRSSQQVVRLFKVLGSGDVTSSGEIEMKKVAIRHPLNETILNDVIEYRGISKMLGTYVKDEEEIDKKSKPLLLTVAGTGYNRIFYTMNPHYTDTGRLSSGESAYWCGVNIQNQPARKYPEIKMMYSADDGYELAEVDYPQSEARCVGYLSQDLGMIDAVESSSDFHSINASRFFGVPYEKIYDNATGKTVDKPLRELSKRVNHGSNYNMGAAVLIDTMGIRAVLKARDLLQLPKNWNLRQIAEHLLEAYNIAYPKVKGDWYDSVKYEVASTKMLTGVTGWTRYCFGNPGSNKLHLNSYVAHVPQSLSVMLINKGFLRLFLWMLSLEPIGGKKPFRLKAQIHDSILFQYLPSCKDWVIPKAMELMVSSIIIHGRTMVIRPTLKSGAKLWGEIK